MVPWREARHGLVLTVRVTPRGGRDAVDGVETMADGREVLKLRVRAAPEGGEANDAVTRLLASKLDMRRADVAVVAGATARIKQVELSGDAAQLGAALARLTKTETKDRQ